MPIYRYNAAHAAISPPLETAALRSGLCACHLRLRKAKEAVLWCDKAHRADEDDLQTLYQLVDAKAMGPHPP